ncbi:MAG: dehydrogenase subunit [Pseudomonadota bacterium]|jgi:NADH-quinone oxidoreductase subunit N
MEPLDTVASLVAIAPACLIFVAAMVVMMMAAVSRPTRTGGLWAVSLAVLVVAGVLSAARLSVEGVPAFAGMLRVDAYGGFFNVVAAISGILAVLMSEEYLARIGVRVGEYYALVLFGVFGMMLMGMSNDLMMVFVSLEVMSLSMYVLAALKRADPRSVEAGFKYFILGAFSSGLMLYGISLVYGAVGSTSLDAVAQVASGARAAAHPSLLAVGGALLVVGFGFKVASVPFHLWTPDVYQGAPTSVTALMSSGVKAASFAAFLRFVVAATGHDGGWTGALWWMAALTMVVGNVSALVQRDLKRMLAYSSIAHAGYLLMALVAVGHPAEAGGVSSAARAAAGSGVLFYAFAYTLMNAGAWAVLTMFVKDGADATDLDALAGLGRSRPWLAAGLSVCLLSLAGFPATIGFIGKFLLFSAAIEAGYVGLAVVGALGAAAGLYYYLRPMVVMFMGEGHPAPVQARWAGAAVAACSVLVLGLGLLPSHVLALAEHSVMSLAR